MPKPIEPPAADAETPLERLEQEYENTEVDEELAVPKTVATAAKASAPKASDDDEAPAPKHSTRILRMCKDLGIEDDEIEGMTQEMLETFVARETRRQLQAARQNGRAENEVERRKEEKKEEEIDWGEFEDMDGKKRKATDEDIHPAVATVIKAQAKKIKELEEQINGTKKVAETSNIEKFEAAFDKSCSRFKKTLGEGTYSQLKGTPYTGKREVIFKEVVAIIQRDSGVKMDEAVEQAVKKVYGASIAKPKPKVDEEDLEEDDAEKARSNYAQGKTARPSGRKGKTPKGQKAAEEAVETWLQENLGDPEEEGDPDSEY